MVERLLNDRDLAGPGGETSRLFANLENGKKKATRTIKQN
jgi:hypothetical protein